jgi:hypothetical protein
MPIDVVFKAAATREQAARPPVRSVGRRLSFIPFLMGSMKQE